jgi:hypothetical protein
VEEGGSPLPIWSLHCGTAIFPRDSAELEQLLHLSHLEEVSVENEDVWNDDSQLMLIYDGEDESSIVFDAFVNAPNLRRLRVRTYAGDVHRAFCSMEDPSRARQIAISARKMDGG